MKLVVMYTQPENVEAFETAYQNHLALVDTIPGMSDKRITRFTKTLQGNGFYLMAEMIFPDADTLKTAMRSPEMAAVGADAQQFGTTLSCMMLGKE